MFGCEGGRSVVVDTFSLILLKEGSNHLPHLHAYVHIYNYIIDYRQGNDDDLYHVILLKSVKVVIYTL